MFDMESRVMAQSFHSNKKTQSATTHLNFYVYFLDLERHTGMQLQ